MSTSTESATASVEAVGVVDDLHGPPAEHIARPDERRIADPLDDLRAASASDAAVPPPVGDLETGAECRPPLGSSAMSIAAALVPQHERGRETVRELERRLARADDDAGDATRAAAQLTATMSEPPPR